jgi:hypothetical protein
MKAKKAIKRLQRVELLLGTVIDEFAAGTPEVRDLLNTARAGVESATKAVAASPVPEPAPKTGKDQAGKRLVVPRKRRSVTAAAKA